MYVQHCIFTFTSNTHLTLAALSELNLKTSLRDDNDNNRLETVQETKLYWVVVDSIVKLKLSSVVLRNGSHFCTALLTKKHRPISLALPCLACRLQFFLSLPVAGKFAVWRQHEKRGLRILSTAHYRVLRGRAGRKGEHVSQTERTCTLL